MKTDVILVDGERWRWFGHRGETAVVDPYPRLHRPARVLVNFSGAFTGVLRFEGKTQFARALIDREVRREGWVDGPNHIVIHHLSRARDGGQAFYTAVPLEAWQRLLQWIRGENDHCLVYPAGALLADVREGEGRILHLDRCLLVFARGRDDLSFEDVYSATGEAEDQQLAARTLGANIAAFAAQSGHAGPLRPEWLTALAAPDDELETSLIERVQDAAGVPVRRTRSQRFRDGDGEVLSALPRAVNRLGAAASSNPVREKTAWWSESMAPAVLTAVGALAVGLGAAGQYTHGLAAQERESARTLKAAVQDRSARIREADFPDRSGTVAELSAFVGRLDRGAPYTPVQVLASIREAAGPGLTVYRVRLESSPRDGYRLRVDGTAGNEDGGAIRRFLATLRRDGWHPVPLKPASDAPGSFSYRLAPGSQDT
ncbi:hypothetical protein ACEZHJ_09105 [Arhodomonas sp. KWT2]|uniref:hypothetical protein n=1 Tax=Arhodomonas sp. KWT2 TaxID=3344194 RepID=UPI0035C2411C